MKETHYKNDFFLASLWIAKSIVIDCSAWNILWRKSASKFISLQSFSLPYCVMIFVTENVDFFNTISILVQWAQSMKTKSAEIRSNPFHRGKALAKLLWHKFPVRSYGALSVFIFRVHVKNTISSTIRFQAHWSTVRWHCLCFCWPGRSLFCFVNRMATFAFWT